MENAEKERLLRRYLEDHGASMSRPAIQFLSLMTDDQILLERMSFCHADERASLRNSIIIIATADCSLWGALLDNPPHSTQAARQDRSRLVLSLLNLSAREVAEQLRRVPIWFLALEPGVAAEIAGDAQSCEETVFRLAALPSALIRQRVLWDQMDAALDCGEFAACARIWQQIASIAAE